ncbi:MAG: response regulator transcription factor [Muribaculaceae bacterium]|nr:response regulator transcription factor [Muribaculaceae bacterium]
MSQKNYLSQMKIAVIDDHDLIREGLNAILHNHGAAHVDMYGTAMGLVDGMDSGKRYDFYIVDLELPDIDGFVLIEMIRAREENAKVIVSTVHDEIWTLRKLLAREVDGIIYKSGDGNDIVEAIRAITEGTRYYSEEARRSLEYASDNAQHPSARELEVLHKIAQGKTSREIAASMFVSENTIEAHRKALFSKIGAVNVADLIVKSIEKGYLKSGIKQ